jgi:glycosyltransferase involved in cell wall biosynthesis
MKKFLIIGNSAFSILNFRKHMLLEARARGCEIHCVVYENDGSERIKALEDLGWTCHRLKMSRKGRNPWHDFRYFIQIYRLLLQINAEFLFSYTIKPVIYCGLALWFLKKKPRTCAMISGLGYAFMGSGLSRLLIKNLARILYKLSLRAYNIVVFQNPDDQELFKALRLIGRSQEVIRVHGSGVDLAEFPFTPLEFSGDGRIRFLMIARVLKAKGVFEYLRAAKKINESYTHKAEFAFVGPIDLGGDGIRLEEFQRLCDESKVTYHGEQCDVRPFIKWCHMFVLPSYREGLPRTIIEAMAIGRGIVTTDVPGCRECLSDPPNGYLVPMASSSSLENVFKQILETDYKKISDFSDRSRLAAMSNFNVIKVTHDILKLLLN